MTRRLVAVVFTVAGLVAFTGACVMPPPGGTGFGLPAGCLNGTGTDGNAAPDLLFSGSPNVKNNATFFARIADGQFFLSGDGSCQGLPVGAVTIVQAASQEAAGTTCSALGAGATATALDGDSYTGPADAWVCSETSTF